MLARARDADRDVQAGTRDLAGKPDLARGIDPAVIDDRARGAVHATEQFGEFPHQCVAGGAAESACTCLYQVISRVTGSLGAGAASAPSVVLRIDTTLTGAGSRYTAWVSPP